jgi:hypothetical protein
MTTTKSSLIEREVDRLFAEHPPIDGQLCMAPITNAFYVGGDDPVNPQKEAVHRTLLAREWWYVHGPAELQPLPLSGAERDAFCGRTLLAYVFHWFARSLESRKFDIKEHPYFADYVSGVLWENDRPDNELGTLPNYGETQLAELKRRYPPRRLAGLGPAFCWYPLKQHADVMKRLRESERWRQQREAGCTARGK